MNQNILLFVTFFFCLQKEKGGLKKHCNTVQKDEQCLFKSFLLKVFVDRHFLYVNANRT